MGDFLIALVSFLSGGLIGGMYMYAATKKEYKPCSLCGVVGVPRQDWLSGWACCDMAGCESRRVDKSGGAYRSK